MKSLIIACAALLLVSPAIAADATTYEFDGSFDDALSRWKMRSSVKA